MTEVPMPDEDTNIAHLSAEQLASYIDGNLTPAEHNAALTHFDDCADCRREMTDARRVIALATPARAEPARAPTASGRARVWVAAALAAVVVFAVVPTVLRNRSGPDGATRGPDRLPQSETVSQLAIVAPVDDGAITAASDSFVWRAASADADGLLAPTLADAVGVTAVGAAEGDCVTELPGAQAVATIANAARPARIPGLRTDRRRVHDPTRLALST